MKSRKQILAILKRKGQFGKKSRLSVSAGYGMDALDAVIEGRALPAPVIWSVNRGHRIHGKWVPVPLMTFDHPESAVDEYLRLMREEEE